MIKILKKLIHKIYVIGKFEENKISAQKRQELFHKAATIHETAHISEEARIYNNSRSSDKLRINANSRIMGHLFLFDSGGEIEIGQDCFVGPDTRIWSAKKITIGSRVLIAHSVNIHDNISHPLDANIRYKEYVSFYKTGIHNFVDLRAKEVIIEDDVWIGFNSIILKGVHIGRGAIIGAGSVVTKDVEAWTVNVGNPLRCVQKLQPVDVLKMD
jgi:acetyltransferase-like isoleucine patch superfamily enzyme